MQHKITQAGRLLNDRGQLMDAGYAFSAVKRYERGRIWASPLRIKEWDYYLIANDRAALALTVSDLGYLGLDSVSLIDFEQRTQRTQTRTRLLPRGGTSLPDAPLSGTVRSLGRQYEMTFRRDGDTVHLYGHMYDFGGKRVPLLFDLILYAPPQDAMTIITPFKHRKHCFYYNQKVNCLAAEGRVILDDREYLFSPMSASGVLDWGRGVWPYANTWYWASASGTVLGRPFGMNFGYGFGDTSAATENMLFYDGRGYKLEDVVFDIPRKGLRRDYLAPWHVRDSEGRVELRFDPILDRSAHTNALIVKSDQHQVFGRYTGYVRLTPAHTLQLNHLIGFAERVSNRW